MKHGVFLGGVAVATLAAGLGVTACGGSTSSQGAAATASATPPATSTRPAATSTSGSIAGIPFYQPSHVVHRTARSALLTSPDSLAKVIAFYVNEVDTGGWTTVSNSITAYSGNLTIKKAGQGAAISISPSGSGSRVSISAYPTT